MSFPLPLFALLAGAAIAVQANLNAQLGVLLRSPMLSAAVAFMVSAVFVLSAWAMTNKPAIPTDEWNASVIQRVPWYLWFAGGALSAFGVAMFYFLIPKLGVGPTTSYALSGQLVIAAIASHYSWLGLPGSPLTTQKMVGFVALIIGVILVNGGLHHES